MSLQQANLLVAELVPHKDPFGTRQLTTLWLGFLSVLVVVSLWYQFDNSQLKQAVQAENGKLAMLRNANATTRGELVSPKALGVELAALRERVDARASLLQILQGKQVQKGFAEHFRSLAGTNSTGVWIEEIHIKRSTASAIDGQDGVHLKGLATAEHHVPEFLQALSQAAAFKGQMFAEITLEQEPESQLVSFTVSKKDTDRT